MEILGYLIAGLVSVGVYSLYSKINSGIKQSVIEKRIKEGSANAIEIMEIIQFYLNKKKFEPENLNIIKQAEKIGLEGKELDTLILAYYVVSKNLDDALNKVSSLCELHPEDPDYLFAKGHLHLKLGDDAIANEYRNKAIALDSSYSEKSFNKDI